MIKVQANASSKMTEEQMQQGDGNLLSGGQFSIGGTFPKCKQYNSLF